MSSAPLDPKLTALAQQLDKLDSDLVSAEESMLSRLRAPLSRTDPAGDLANRLKEQEVRGIKSQTEIDTGNCVIHFIFIYWS